MEKKKYTLKERFLFTLNYVKNFAIIITPLTLLMGYVGTLVIKDSDIYKRVNAVVVWYEEKSNSFAVCLRVNKEIDKDTGKTIYRVVYKATDGETYKAFHKKEYGAWYYRDSNDKLQECH